ncbi:HAD family phosphatase [Candidatus Dojkabacteria bacterium]|jgi:FMN phosphatase YigB (HAD superfamily)|nr:HAD family phosphatase [Candidatus Dojkabacteria bacterium]
MNKINPKTILFDLDDTLIETHEVFRAKIDEANQVIADELGIPFIEIHDAFNKENDEAHYIVYVNPKKVWPLVLDNLNKKYKFSKDTHLKALSIIKSVFTTPVRTIDGTRELLSFCKDRGVQLGLVTHAQKRWTNFKLKNTNILEYFSHIEVVNTNRDKKPNDWLRAFKALDTSPKMGMIVGDNKKGDILAGHTIGTKHLVWFDRTETWSLYKTGDLPESVITINSLYQLKDLLS